MKETLGDVVVTTTFMFGTELVVPVPTAMSALLGAAANTGALVASRNSADIPKAKDLADFIKEPFYCERDLSGKSLAPISGISVSRS